MAVERDGLQELYKTPQTSFLVTGAHVITGEQQQQKEKEKKKKKRQ
jgi:hypothetical protein